MSDDLDKKLLDKIDRKLVAKSKRGKLSDGFDKNKVVNEVLDRPTVMTLYKMINSHIISYVNGVISAGKESLVFWAVNEVGKDVALKIYLVTTTAFKKRLQYVVGDPRFSKVKSGTKSLVYTWAKKEFRNLSQCYENGLPVPKPIHVANNVLAMEFIGNNGRPANRLVESEVDENDFKCCVNILKQLYQKAGLIHGDFSEYNVFKIDKGLRVFDMGSAVDIKHPNAEAFLKRDINNITRFFSKRGISTEYCNDLFVEVTK